MNRNFHLFALVLSLASAGSLRAADPSPLTWTQAVKQALQSNPSLASARLGIKAADEGLSVANAGLWPSVNAVAGINRSHNTALQDGPLQVSGQESTSAGYSGGLQGSWNLFNGFSTLYLRGQRQQALAQAKAQYALSSASLLQSLHLAFNQLLYDQKNNELLKAIADRYHQDTLYQQLEFEAGKTARWTFLKSQSDEAGVKWDLEQNVMNTQADQAAFAGLLGQDPDQSSGLTVEGDLTVAAPPKDDSADWAKLSQTSPAILIQKAATAGADDSLGQAYSSLYPSLSASGNITYSGGDTWGPSNQSYGAGLNLSFNLFNGGGQVAAISQARAQLDASRQDLVDAIHAARSNLRKAWASYQSAFDRLPVQDLAKAAGEERFKTVGALYQSGRAAYLDYEQAESIYTQAQQQDLSTGLNAATAQANYQNALGLGLEDAVAAPAP
jgi:outer membrane protein TolC